MPRASWKVSITPADNGVVVRVGCKLLVFSKKAQPKFLDLLERYLNGEEDNLRQELLPEEGSRPDEVPPQPASTSEEDF